MVLLKTYLPLIPDPRRSQGKRYDLPHVLLFSILAILSGATSYRKIHRFIRARREQLNAWCGVAWKRAPAHTSIRYVLQGLEPATVETAFREHARHLAQHPTDAGCQIACDGKTLRGSFDHFEDQHAVQLFSALATDTPLILGHVLISTQATDKTHEIPAAQQLIDELKLTDRLFTLDALHAQKTVERVRQNDNHLLVQLKRNQPTLYDAFVERIVPQPVADVHRTHEVGQRNRIEQRVVSVWPLAAGFGSEPWHDHFQTGIRVERHTEVFDTRRKDWAERCETAYYLTTQPLTAHQAAQLIRTHWHVENRLHYVRDVTLGEDASRIRRNPGIFALLRSFALNLLRVNGIDNISEALYDNALDFNRVLAYQGL